MAFSSVVTHFLSLWRPPPYWCKFDKNMTWNVDMEIRGWEKHKDRLGNLNHEGTVSGSCGTFGRKSPGRNRFTHARSYLIKRLEVQKRIGALPWEQCLAHMWRVPQAVAGKPMRRKGTRTGLNIDKLKVWDVVGHILKRPRFQQLLNRSRSLWCQRFVAFCEGAKGSHLLLGWSGWSWVPWLVVRQYFGRCPSLLAKTGSASFCIILKHVENWVFEFFIVAAMSGFHFLHLFVTFCDVLFPSKPDLFGIPTWWGRVWDDKSWLYSQKQLLFESQSNLPWFL